MVVIDGSRNKKTNPLFKRTYSIWKAMMYRCYDSNCLAYKNYGAKGVRVCEKWKTLNGFIEDMDKIVGFDLQRFINGDLSLDKDKLGDSKEYCLEKCCWISKTENNQYKPNQQVRTMAISPDGEKFVFSNQSKFAKEHNLCQSHISACINGKESSCKGWRFTKI